MDEPTPRHWSDRIGAALASRWALPLLALAGFAISLVVQQVVYPGLSWNRDEPVYLWHVDVLRAGQLSAPDGGHPELFRPWLSAARDGTVFSQYTLGWPLVLLLGSLVGSTDLAVAAGAALAIVGTWCFVHEHLRDRAIATVAAALMLASPIFAVQGGTHLNYLFTLGLGLLFATRLAQGVRDRSAWRLVTAGALLGWVFFTRPYDALVWGLVGAVPVLLVHRRAWSRLLPAAAWAALGLLPLVVITLVVNHRLTGSPFEFPITAADPLDQFGFGRRRLMPDHGKIKYGPRLAIESVGRNAFWLPLFLIGAHLGAVVAAAGTWAGRRTRGVWVLVGLGVVFPVTYFAFFGTHISSLTARLSGPIYYVPSYTALCGLIAYALIHLGRRHVGRAALLVLALLVVTVPIGVSRLAVNRDLSHANEPWADSIAEIDARAIVVPSPSAYLLFVNPYGDNGADLDGRILFAADEPELLDLLAEHPDRIAYLQRADRSLVDLFPSEDTEVPVVSLTRMEVLEGPVHVLGTVHEVTDEPSTVWWIEVDERPVTLPTSVAGEQPIDLDLVAMDLPAGLHTLEVKVGTGASVARAVQSPIVRRTFYLRVPRGGSARTLDLLAPGTAARLVLRPGAASPVWEDALSVPELEVDPVLHGLVDD